MILDPQKNHFDGPISIPIYGEADEDGVIPVVGYRDGFHVNATDLGMAVADFSAFVIEPKSPDQVYAGATHFLKFADEAEAIEAIPAEFWRHASP